MKTTLPKHELKHTKKVWHLIDATGMTLGRLATQIAVKLQGKHKPWYTDMWDCGDYVVVTNVEKIVVTGKKVTDKIYYRHTGYKGHLYEETYEQVMKKDPTRIVEFAVKGMLPKNKTRLHRMKRLKLIVGAEHVYAHQLTSSQQLANKTFVELNK